MQAREHLLKKNEEVFGLGVISKNQMSLIRTSFRIHDPNPLNSQSPESGSKFTVDRQSAEFSKSANPLRLSPKSAIRALFEAKSVDPPTYSPPLLNCGHTRNQQRLFLLTSDREM